MTVFQQSLPSIGPGKLESREDPNLRAGEVSASSLNPATDFYKKMALDCSGHQVSYWRSTFVMSLSVKYSDWLFL